MKLSPTMVEALKSAAELGFETVRASRSTEIALVRRGLATVETGKSTYRRGGHHYTVWDAYHGIRLNAAGVALAKSLAA